MLAGSVYSWLVYNEIIPKELWEALKEWYIKVPRRWWEVIINVSLTFIPLLVGLIAFIHWAGNATPPLPWWIMALIIGGAILFFAFSFFAFRRVVMERNEIRSKLGRDMLRIPELLRQMNKRLDCLVEVAKIPEADKMMTLSKDAGELFTFDISQLQAIVDSGDSMQLKGAIHSVSMQAVQSMQPRATSFISPFISLTGLLNHHNVGLDTVKNGDEEYDTLEGELHMLKDQLHTARAKASLDAFALWRDAVYSFKLIRHYNTEQSIPEEILPAQAKALLPLIGSIVDTFLEKQLSQVEESIRRKGE